jgi:hypothetical protein
MAEFVCSNNLYLFADFRPEPAAIENTRCASFDTDLSSPTISASSIG